MIRTATIIAAAVTSLAFAPILLARSVVSTSAPSENSEQLREHSTMANHLDDDGGAAVPLQADAGASRSLGADGGHAHPLGSDGGTAKMLGADGGHTHPLGSDGGAAKMLGADAGSATPSGGDAGSAAPMFRE